MEPFLKTEEEYCGPATNNAYYAWKTRKDFEEQTSHKDEEISKCLKNEEFCYMMGKENSFVQCSKYAEDHSNHKKAVIEIMLRTEREAFDLMIETKKKYISYYIEFYNTH